MKLFASDFAHDLAQYAPESPIQQPHHQCLPELFGYRPDIGFSPTTWIKLDRDVSLHADEAQVLADLKFS